MACFNEEDMKRYISELGRTITVERIDKEHELHFVTDLICEIKAQGVTPLITRYAPLVTLMKRGEKLSREVLKGVIDTVNLAVSKVHEDVLKVGDKFTSLSEGDQKYLQQVVGVALWLTYSVLEEFNFLSSLSTQITREKKSRNEPTGVHKLPFAFWYRGKNKLLESVASLLELNLLPIFESNVNLSNKKIFYELIMYALVNCLRYGARDIMRSDDVSDLIMTIFEIFITNLGLEDQLVRSLVFNIMDTEEVARPVCKILIGLEQNYDLPNIIRKAIAKSMESVQNREHQDKLDKGFAVFLIEIGTTFPGDIKEHSLPYILQFVESDIVALRNAVLSVIVEVVGWHKDEIDNSKITADENSKLFRQKMLAYIEDFVCDVNAIVRNKAVTLLSKLIETQGLFTDELLAFANEVVHRVLDSTPSTRKNALHFFSTLIESEPIIAKYTPDAFYEFALGQRRAFLNERLTHVQSDKNTIIKISVKEFTYHIKQKYMRKALRNRPLIDELKSPDSAGAHIRKLASEMKIWEACECLFLAVDNYVDEEAFRVFSDSHSYEIYLMYICSEIGIDLASLRENSMSQLDSVELMETEDSEASRELHRQLHICETLSEVLLNSVIPTVLLLLEKGSSTDQIETLSFFGTLSSFDYPIPPNVEVTILEIVSGMNRSLISSVLEPFSKSFLKGPNSDTPLGLMKILVALCDRLGSEKRGCIAFLIEEMVLAKNLHVPELKILWDIVAMKIPQMGHHESKIALYILYICGKAERSCIASLNDLILEVPLGSRGFDDMEFAHLGLLAFGELLSRNNDSTYINPPRLPVASPIFRKIYDLIKHCLNSETRDAVSDHFIGVFQTGIGLVYNHCIQPGAIIACLISQSSSLIFGDTPDDVVDMDIEEVTYEHTMDEKLILKFLVLAGAIISRHSIYHMLDILEEVKKRKTLHQIDAINSTTAVRSRLRRSFMEISHRRRSSARSQISFSKSVEDSLLKADHQELEAVVGQIGFDREIENLRSYMKSLLDDGVIHFYWQFVQHICRRYHKIQTLKLRIAIVQLLGHCMLVGSKAMKTGVEIIVKLWKIVTTAEEKVEIIVMAILLNDCYPNEMDECNNLILSGLRSQHAQVRLMCLDFVILLTQDNVLKVKDILLDTVLALSDEYDDIRDAAKVFLRICQEKDTMLHSSVPDIASRVSASPSVSRKNFKVIMWNFLQLFKKVADVISIIDKLLDRFCGAGLKGAAAEDNAYCLSLLPYNDRGFKLIRDRFHVYASYLSNASIYESFGKVVESAKQHCKADSQETLEDFVTRLQETKQKYSHCEQERSHANL